MRILHVIPSLSPRRGGPGGALRLMATGLSSRGVTVDVVTTDDDGPGRAPVSRVRPVREGCADVWYFPRQTKFYTFSWPLTAWLAGNIPVYDAVHIHALFTYASLPAALLATRSGVPYIVRPLGTLGSWGMDNRRSLLKRLSFQLVERRILDGAAAIHYTSSLERSDATRLELGAPAFEVPIGVEASQFEMLPSPEALFRRFPVLAGRRVVLFLSRIDRKKGLDLLIPALAEASRRFDDLALVIAGAGDSDLMAELDALGRDVGIADRMVWAGHVKGREKLEVLAAAEVFVLPSYSENFGIAAVEAMAAGLPVILSEQVGISPEVQAYGSGLVTRCSTNDVSDALCLLLQDPATAQLCGSSGKNLVRTKFSVEAMAEGLLQMYQQVVDACATGAA